MNLNDTNLCFDEETKETESYTLHAIKSLNVKWPEFEFEQICHIDMIS